MTIIAYRLQEIIAAIQRAQTASPYQQQVQLVAVSKAQPADAIRAAYAAGQKIFGENYLQEALDKQAQLTDLDIEWHFIGPIQSNKTQPISQHFSWVHSVDRLKIAQRLNDARPDNLPPLQICLQLNVSNEASKSGVAPDDVMALASQIQQLPKLKLRGLMAIPAPSQNEALQTAQFKQVRQCYDALVAEGFQLDTLSIGMSDDFQAAIAQGATFVRIGSALFGARPAKVTH
jgi:pyridoxal phosphate enzyme (YggS family)